MVRSRGLFPVAISWSRFFVFQEACERSGFSEIEQKLPFAQSSLVLTLSRVCLRICVCVHVCMCVHMNIIRCLQEGLNREIMKFSETELY